MINIYILLFIGYLVLSSIVATMIPVGFIFPYGITIGILVTMFSAYFAWITSLNNK